MYVFQYHQVLFWIIYVRIVTTGVFTGTRYFVVSCVGVSQNGRAVSVQVRSHRKSEVQRRIHLLFSKAFITYQKGLQPQLGFLLFPTKLNQFFRDNGLLKLILLVHVDNGLEFVTLFSSKFSWPLMSTKILKLFSLLPFLLQS